MNKNIKNNQKLLTYKSHPIDFDEIMEYRDNQPLIIDRAYEYIEEGNYERAYQLFSIGAYLNNSDPDVLNGLGILLCELNRIEEAKIILKRAARFNPDDSITLANLAGVCWEMDELDEAIYYYNRSMEIPPVVEDIYVNLINLYLEAGYLYMAYATCLKFKEEYPDDEEADDLLEEVILNLALSVY